MATWKKATGEPITTESEVRVYNPETGEEGYVSVSRDLSRDHTPQFFGAVKAKRQYFTMSGVEIAEPTYTVIDAEPTFA